MLFPHLNPSPVKEMDLRPQAGAQPISGLRECRAKLLSATTCCWYEYVPHSYDGTAAVPLVLHIHGGRQDGKRFAEASAWHLVAERANFIVVYPNSLLFEHWECSEKEIEYLARLIEHLASKYNIDRSRIYMQGFSNGDLMTQVFAQKKGGLLAAAGMITGPAPDGFLQDPVCRLPIIRVHGEKDMTNSAKDPADNPFQTRDSLTTRNLSHWIRRNGAAKEPVFFLHGKDNFTLYPGEAPVIFWEVKDLPHCEPPHTAQVFWDFLYSGCRQNGAEAICGTPKKTIVPDPQAFAFALGSGKLWRGGRVLPACAGNETVLCLQPEAKVPNWLRSDALHSPQLYAPVTMLAPMTDAQVETDSSDETASVRTQAGDHLVFRNRSELVLVNGRIDAMKKSALTLCGALYVPILEVLQEYFGLRVSVCDDVVYVSRNYAELAHGTARLIRETLGGFVRQLTDTERVLQD